MAIANKKKAQTVVNLLRDLVVARILAADGIAALLRQAVIDNGLAGEFSPEELSALASFVTDLSALASSPVVSALENRYVLTHRSAALTIPGVND